MTLESIIQLAFSLASLGFFLATVITGIAWTKVGKSALRTVLSYLFIGTGTFFVITIFQTLGTDYFGISDDSMDMWWHVMFYLAMGSYFLGIKALTKLGGDVPPKGAGVWGVFSVIVLAVVFVIPGAAEPAVLQYSSSPIAALGFHHFLSFAVAALVASYLLSARKNLGMIGKAIASPMLIAIIALCIQHFWELLFESWKVVQVTTEVGEGIEKIFLITAAVCMMLAATRLTAFAKPPSP
jgi:hypothetical protein